MLGTRRDASVELEGLGKRFGKLQALQGLTLDIGEGELVSVTGPSGAGKSTLARLISGLEVTGEGRISVAGKDITHLPPQARRVSHMFESYALYPTRSVVQNIRSPLDAPGSLGRWSDEQKRKRIEEVLELTEMAPLRDRLPSQLSGGQKQRVALCRALVQDPSIFVLDEPIGHLDAKLRHKLRGDIRRRQGKLKQGTLWLTPDGVEALAVADRIAVLVGGVLQQLGTPDEVFARPANIQVARLIGDPAMNVVPVQLQGGALPSIAIGSAPPEAVSSDAFACLASRAGRRDSRQEGRLLLGIRPSSLRIMTPTPGSMAGAAEVWLAGASVYAVEPLGKHTLLTVELGGQRLSAKVESASRWAIGMPATIAFDPDQTVSFDIETGLLQVAGDASSSIRI